MRKVCGPRRAVRLHRVTPQRRPCSLARNQAQAGGSGGRTNHHLPKWIYAGEVKGQERPPWSRLRYLFHGWTVSHGLSPIAKPSCTKARWRSEPQRGGFIVARGKPGFAAPPRVSQRPAHRGRAHDHEYDRQSPSPPRAAPRFDPETVDHSDWIMKILHDAQFCYAVVGDIIRIHGYLPKSFDELDANEGLEKRK